MGRAWIVVGLCVWALAGCGENETRPAGHLPYTGEEAEPLACVPNLDGRIEAQELREVLGIPVSYLISPAGQDRAVDIAGGVDAQGARVWDWSEERADDQLLRVAAKSARGMWYEDRFPEDAFVVPFDAGETIHALYQRDDEALWLWGLASVEEEPEAGQTLLVYQDPVALQRFPIMPGEDRVEVGEVERGTLLGLPYAGRDVYEIQVDAAGRLELPDLSFTQALRVRQKVSVEPAVGQGTSRRQVSFLFECFGEVARATSRAGEPEADFSQATELRRLGLE